jgi:hypothetical protein
MKRLVIELKETAHGSLQWRIPSEGTKWAHVDGWKVDGWLKDHEVPKRAIADLHRRNRTKFSTLSRDNWQYMYGLEEEAGTLSGTKGTVAGMSNMTKILLLGSVGLVGVGAFVWWRGRKLARETATEMFSSGASTGAAPRLTYKRTDDSGQMRTFVMPGGVKARSAG